MQAGAVLALMRSMRPRALLACALVLGACTDSDPGDPEPADTPCEIAASNACADVAATASSESGSSPSDGTVRLAPAQTYAAGTTPYYLTAADLDADGVLDLVVSSPDDAGGQTTVDLLAGDGGGAFAMQNQVLTSAPGETVVSDVDGDGTVDVVGVAYDGQGALPAFHLHGQGAFGYAMTTWGEGRAFLARLDAADFDEDGALELVAPYADPDNPIGGFVIVSSFAVVQDDPAFGPDTVAAIAGDVDGDGHADVIAASRTTSDVRVYTGDGTGTVTFAAQVSLGGGAIRQLAAIDLDADGSAELVALAADGAVTVTAGLASGSPASLQFAGGSSVRGIVAGDFDHDGRLDLAIGNAGNEIAVYLATNAGFERGATLMLPDAWSSKDFAVGDFDGDGFDDLASTTSGGVAVFRSTP